MHWKTCDKASSSSISDLKKKERNFCKVNKMETKVFVIFVQNLSYKKFFQSN